MRLYSRIHSSYNDCIEVTMIAKIAVSAAVYAMDRPWDYRVPDALEATILPGMRVIVPFGQGNRRREGMVLALTEGETDGLKPVDCCLDAAPILSDELLRTVAFVRERYFCTLYDAVRAALPAGVWYAGRQTWTAVKRADTGALLAQNPSARPVFQAVLDGQREQAALEKLFPDTASLQASLKYLQGCGLLSPSAEFSRRVQDRTEKIVELAAAPEEALQYAERHRRTAPLQSAVLELLAVIGSGMAREIRSMTGATTQTLNRLEKLGYLTLTEREAFRRPAISDLFTPAPLQLTPEQAAACSGLREQMASPRPGAALLYGVTGSGKTTVYLQLIADCLAQGKSAMLLVPEIALTPQLLRLFVSWFGEQVAVLHSALTMAERYDEWKRIRAGTARVVIGTRSAVFAPLQNPGLLILDEEQEHTYKSENTPRYHAREVAIYRGARLGALVLLGSATPSVETMYHARAGTWGYYCLPSRYNGRSLPPAEIVDMKQELRRGNASSISATLQKKLEAAMAAGHQSILFLNRRGTSQRLSCVDCGQSPQCPRCSVSLTWHADRGRLMCHHCGFSMPAPERCPACGGPLKQVGTGTQKVQEELERLFPGKEVLRMDADTVSAVNTHEKLLNRFRKEKIPILVGTQMVTRGLDFENVTLAAVLDADMSLYVDSFRASETTFSLITQVAGRSGRGEAEGCAVVQTMTPEHSVINQAAAQDYDTFYETEIALRELRGCPPFGDFLVLTFTGLEEERVMAGAVRFRDAFSVQLQAADLPVTLLGPAPAAVTRVNNIYRYRLTLCCRNSRPLRLLLSAEMKKFAKDTRSRGVNVFADVNPFDT